MFHKAKKQKIKKWKLENKEGWKKFNENMSMKADNITNYDQLEKEVMQTLNNKVGYRIITPAQKKTITNELLGVLFYWLNKS